MLHLEQKWRSQLPTQSGGLKRTKVSATGAYSSSSNPDTSLVDESGVDSPVRPQGSKNCKRKGKEKAQMSEDLSKKIYRLLKNYLSWKILRIEEERAYRAKIMVMKEKELQIQAAMKEQELQT
ncbi:hypothetical protein Ahy_A08g039321 [Arachis hypogaea]|uniref:No apical meristem-associated C-terminal domain-containing protein n=1 Tax=Arachis hypogaea TaxID=3818 RepID=A0A445BVY7_ARAHY|nr:hypothetical protein Ahy_A08g039321 [Arachis hypogaea]